MEPTIQISDDFINSHTDFAELIAALQEGFAQEGIIVPQRHHHDFPNPETGAPTTLLLMPAWHPGKESGVKVVSVSPENSQFNLPSIQGIYLLMDATTGTTKAIMQAKSLTAQRTAAASALASTFLSEKEASSMLMIGTGALSTCLIRAHASVRPITTVYVWGRNFEKATAICHALENEKFHCQSVRSIEEKIGGVDIISCATLSKTPLIRGESLHGGQHIDLVGAFKKDMREADDATIKKASLFVDTLSGLMESGDIATPIETGVISRDSIKGNLFSLCSGSVPGRTSPNEITVFKSVGHALEDLVAASYYYKRFQNE